MPTKKTIDQEQLVDDIHAAVRAYIEAGGGNVLVIGPMEIVPHRGMEFDVVIKCVGKRPAWS